MKETLLDRAISNLRAAKLNFDHRNEDEFYLNLTGYLLQQATELTLKHLLETHGVKYPRTHDIGELLGLVPDNLLDAEDNLLMMSGTITNWESKTRYIKNYFLEERQLRIGFVVVENLLKNVQLIERKCGNSISGIYLE